MMLAGWLIAMALLAGAEGGAAERGGADRPGEVSVAPEPGLSVMEAARFETLDGPLLAGALTGERPIALAPVYFTCPTVCGVTELQIARAFEEAGLTPGQEAELVFLSFDPRDDAETAFAARARIEAAAPGLADPEVHVAWGGDARAFLDALGYQRYFDPASEEFAHPAALAVITPEGKVSRWLGPQGLSGDQLRRALVEASNGTIGSVLERALLLCWRFDPETGRYTPRILLILQLLGALTVLALGGFIFTHLRRP